MLPEFEERRAVERRREADANFLRFWEAYPRRQARIDAVKAWNQIRPDAGTVEAILAALEWQRETWDSPQFIPLPASYLRGHRWEDERPEQPASKSMSAGAAAVFRVLGGKAS